MKGRAYLSWLNWAWNPDRSAKKETGSAYFHSRYGVWKRTRWGYLLIAAYSLHGQIWSKWAHLKIISCLSAVWQQKSTKIVHMGLWFYGQVVVAPPRDWNITSLGAAGTKCKIHDNTLLSTARPSAFGESFLSFLVFFPFFIGFIPSSLSSSFLSCFAFLRSTYLGWAPSVDTV